MITEQITIDPSTGSGYDTGPYLVETAKQNDLEVIQEVLMERGEPLTLDNARFVLAIGLKNKPNAWTITPEELPALWAELCHLHPVVHGCELVEGMAGSSDV